MSRVQLALDVVDLEASVAFYSTLFGVEPHKRRPGYANFAIAEPPLKLVLIQSDEATRGSGAKGALNHLGVEVGSGEEVTAARTRLAGDRTWCGLGPTGCPADHHKRDTPRVERLVGCRRTGVERATRPGVRRRWVPGRRLGRPRPASTAPRRSPLRRAARRAPCACRRARRADPFAPA